MRRHRSRLLLLVLLLVALVAGGCADDGELGGPTIGGALAASVGGDQLTVSDLRDEVENWAVDPQIGAAFGVDALGEPGRRDASFVAAVLSFRIGALQSRQLARSAGFQPAPEQLSQAVSQLQQNFPAYDEGFITRLAEDLLYQDNLATIDPSTAQAPPVAVNPRFGTFEDQGNGIGLVVPPTGPRPAPSS